MISGYNRGKSGEKVGQWFKVEVMCKEDGGCLLGEIPARPCLATVAARAKFSAPPDTGFARSCILIDAGSLAFQFLHNDAIGASERQMISLNNPDRLVSFNRHTFR